MEKSVDAYLGKLKGWQGEVARRLRALAQEAAPGATEAIKWGQPVFELNGGPLGYYKAHSQHVTLGFWRGAELPDPEGLLESSGSMMAHVKIRGPDQLPEAALKAFIRAAAELNRRDGSPTRRATVKKKAAAPKKKKAATGKRKRS